jgi:ketosteroid isomerase-like protein
MSQENVEVVRRSIDAYNGHDVDLLLDIYDTLFTPDVEWYPAMGAIEGEVFRGRDGMEVYFRRLIDAWEEIRVVAEEVRDLGDRLLVLGRLAGRGSSSGVPVDSPVALIYDLRSGRICRVRVFLDHGEALRAAGLTE